MDTAKYWSLKFCFEDMIQNGPGTAPGSQGVFGQRAWVLKWVPGNFSGAGVYLVQLPGQVLNFFCLSEK
jgi:hypothetical protein